MATLLVILYLAIAVWFLYRRLVNAIKTTAATRRTGCDSYLAEASTKEEELTCQESRNGAAGRGKRRASKRKGGSSRAIAF